MKPLLKPRKPAYVYHWGRILTGMATLLLMAGVVYGLLSWLVPLPQEELVRAEISTELKIGIEEQHLDDAGDVSQPSNQDAPRSFSQEEQEARLAQVTEATDVSSGSQSEVTPPSEEMDLAVDGQMMQQAEKKAQEIKSPTLEIAQLTSGNETVGEDAEEIFTDPLNAGEKEPAFVTLSSDEWLTPLSVDEVSASDAGVSQNTPSEFTNESPLSADKTLSADATNSPFQLKERKIHESLVKRFLLARTVSNREPLGELDEISFDADGSAVVWVYSEVLDMRGNQLNYVWLQEGNQLAVVPVDIRGNRWRSYSSKVINQSMRGAWRVELQDGEGRLMASTDFYLE